MEATDKINELHRRRPKTNPCRIPCMSIKVTEVKQRKEARKEE